MARHFLYRARNRQGKIIRGNISAESTVIATAMLRAKKLYVIEIKPFEKPVIEKGLPLIEPKLSTKDLAVFCRQFATMIRCGVPIIQCLNILAQQTGNKKLVEAIEGVIEKLKKGQSLAESCRGYPKIFPRIITSMLEAGEISGTLDSVMERLAVHFEKEHELREKIKSAMTYPAAVTVFSVVTIATLMIFVLPTFVDILSQLNAELPLMTKIVMGAGDLIRSYWYVIIPVIVVAGIVFNRITATGRGRAVVDGLMLRLPVFGGLIRHMVISRFARTLSTLLASGVPLLQAFDVVIKGVDNTHVRQAVTDAVECVKEGQSIARPLQKSNFFPPMFTRIIAIGEETGALDTMLEKLAGFYDREVENTITRLSSMIEPILIVGTGVMVGFIIMSIMLPVFSIMSSID